ncbi:thiamine-phosphate kinase [bacterium]|nr:thiamine-phosphate kinase [bacterium]
MEFELIEKIRKKFPEFIGDDCATINIPKNEKLLVSTDEMVENIHFSREYFTIPDIGYKAVSSAFSDIAAMGGNPIGALFSISLPEKFNPFEIEQLYEGIDEFCRPHGIKILGGNITKSDGGIHITTTVIGSAKAPIPRRGAKVGDLILITGTLGGAEAGLFILKKKLNIQISAKNKKLVERRHIRPEARIEAGKILAQLKISSMIDVSDGLFSDLSHIADESGVGFSIEVEKIPLFPAVKEVARAMNISPYILAAKSGEEYELLFTAQENIATKAQKILEEKLNLSATIIGKITPHRKTATLDGKTIPSQKILGWKHF